MCRKIVQQTWNHYEKQLNSWSLDYKQLKIVEDINMIFRWLNNLQWYCSVVGSHFISVEFKWEKKREKKDIKNRKVKQIINNNHFLLRFHNIAFVQVIFSMLGASSYKFENKGKYYLHLRSTQGHWLIV